MLPRASLVDILAGALKARAVAIIEAGGVVPGWVLKRSGGPRVWIDEIVAAVRLADFGIPMESRMPSPAEAERRLKSAGINPAPILRELSAPGSQRVTLARDEMKNQPTNENRQ